MKFNYPTDLSEYHVRPKLESVEQQVITVLSLMLMLTINFTFTYLIHSYYSQTFYNPKMLGFWLILGNSAILWILFILCKKSVGWTWDQVGLAKPKTWLKPTAMALVLIGILLLILKYLQPVVLELTSPPDFEHFDIFEGNESLLLLTLIYVWLHGAFLQELIFRAFAINAIDVLLGRTRWSPFVGIVLSSLAFGLIHAWQGWGGIILSTIMGLVFGLAYLINARRIWALIFVHGLLDTLTLIQFYIEGT